MLLLLPHVLLLLPHVLLLPSHVLLLPHVLLLLTSEAEAVPLLTSTTSGVALSMLLPSAE